MPPRHVGDASVLPDLATQPAIGDRDDDPVLVNIKPDVGDTIPHDPSPMHEARCRPARRNPRYLDIVRRVVPSSDGHVALREIESRLGLADRLAGCLKDPRMPEKAVHRLAEIIRFRMLMIAAGYEDGNDADTLRRDPMFKLALDRLPSGEVLCSQSTISRLENLPDLRALLRLGRALVEQYCGSFRAVPKRTVLDIDDRSTGCTAVNNCGCSTHTTTIMGSNRLLCLTARGGS
jgi:Transposase DDE domain group 1